MPVRWEIHGRSNFDSHQDYYILEFANYSTILIEELFDEKALCPTSTLSMKKREHLLQPILEITNAQQNMKLINRINNDKKFTFKAAPNKFLKRSNAIPGIKRLHDPDLKECDIAEPSKVPKHIDWRTKGVVNYVKDQVFCGSCWTFAAAGMIESRMNILLQQKSKQEPKVRLSEQSIVDCFWDKHEADPFLASAGCEGG